jgi:hypothetical protein
MRVRVAIGDAAPQAMSLVDFAGAEALDADELLAIVTTLLAGRDYVGHGPGPLPWFTVDRLVSAAA